MVANNRQKNIYKSIRKKAEKDFSKQKNSFSKKKRVEKDGLAKGIWTSMVPKMYALESLLGSN